jgi:hypothetical protein
LFFTVSAKRKVGRGVKTEIFHKKTSKRESQLPTYLFQVATEMKSFKFVYPVEQMSLQVRIMRASQEMMILLQANLDEANQRNNGEWMIFVILNGCRWQSSS